MNLPIGKLKHDFLKQLLPTHNTSTGLVVGPQIGEDAAVIELGDNYLVATSDWIRDVVFGEDASQVRCADIPAVMVVLLNTALAILRFAGYTHIAKTTRYFAAKPKQALKLLNDIF